MHWAGVSTLGAERRSKPVAQGHARPGGGAIRPTVEELEPTRRRRRLSEYRPQLVDGVTELFSLDGEIWKESSLRPRRVCAIGPL